LLAFNESSVIVELDAPDAHTVISLLAGKLHAQGLVSADYGDQTWEREIEHPTGLPTKPFSIAFPHADAQGVHQSALAVAILRNPIQFKNMGDPDENLDVFIVVMLANKNPEEQIQTLRNLALLFGQADKLVALRDQSTPQAVVAWLKQELLLD
jgi:PTS system galactitol-specific IIA component